MNITAEEAKQIMDTEEGYIILDVRTQEEYDEGHIPGAILIPHDEITEKAEDLTPVTNAKASAAEIEDMIFANKIVKHTKSNAIVLAKNKQLCASGVGQTSRVDALKQAIEKAEKEFEIYRKREIELMESDFDKLLKNYKIINS